MVKVAIFASGSGSNAENIIQYFLKNEHIKVTCIISNKADAFVLERATKYGIPTKVFPFKEFSQSDAVISFLHSQQINFIVLAGFLLKVPAPILEMFPDRVINIHPALLPKFGGKGMYGMHVHRAVVDAHEQETGITIHYVNENYDEGDIIFQARCSVLATDTPESVARKVHALEYRYFPNIIESVINHLPKKVRPQTLIREK